MKEKEAGNTQPLTVAQKKDRHRILININENNKQVHMNCAARYCVRQNLQTKFFKGHENKNKKYLNSYFYFWDMQDDNISRTDIFDRLTDRPTGRPIRRTKLLEELRITQIKEKKLTNGPA